MEAPVERVVVLGLAGRAHGKDLHGCFFAVIGDILHDGEARAAVGAVDEGIAVAAVGGIKQFAQTVITGSSIRRDKRLALCSLLTVGDNEGVLVTWGDRFSCNRVDAGQGRRLLGQCALKAIEGL